MNSGKPEGTEEVVEYTLLYKEETTAVSAKGNQYQLVALTVRDNFGTKEIKINEFDWKYNSALKVGLDALNTGDFFWAKRKKEKGYWKIKDVGTGKSPASVPTHSAPADTGSTTQLQEVGRIILSRDRAIIRQNSITNAVAFIGGATSTNIKKFFNTENPVEAVIECAKLFEEYSSGDLDLRKAKEAMAAMSADPNEIEE